MVNDTTLSAAASKMLHQTIDSELKEVLCEFQSRLDETKRISFRNEGPQLRLLRLTMDRQRLVYYAVAKKNPKFQRYMKLLLSIPGVGPDNAAKILAEIADISYFPIQKHLMK